jgi:NhaP-type Na+/H+ or K+/H+ antiporter
LSGSPPKKAQPGKSARQKFWTQFAAGLFAIPVALLARFLSVGSTVIVLRFRKRFPPGSVRILTWGGLRGALAVAMALSIPPGSPRDLIVPVTYVVVVFSILVQGLTIKPLLTRRWKQPSFSKAIFTTAHRMLDRLPFSKRLT